MTELYFLGLNIPFIEPWCSFTNIKSLRESHEHQISQKQMLLDCSQNRSAPIVHSLVKNSTSSGFKPVTGRLLMNTYTMKHKISLCTWFLHTDKWLLQRTTWRGNCFITALSYITSDWAKCVSFTHYIRHRLQKIRHDNKHYDICPQAL